MAIVELAGEFRGLPLPTFLLPEISLPKVNLLKPWSFLKNLRAWADKSWEANFAIEEEPVVVESIKLKLHHREVIGLRFGMGELRNPHLNFLARESRAKWSRHFIEEQPYWS